jgi:hypothetical protein
MISKDESIVTQVAAKIASELTAITETDRSEEAIQSAYLSHFDFVREALLDAHGVKTVVVTDATGSGNAEEAIRRAFGPEVSEETSGGITIKGTQHGPIPAWLTNACRKAGVTSVWDNRDTATVENRRPFFKSADGKTNDKGQPIAFWPPKK